MDTIIEFKETEIVTVNIDKKYIFDHYEESGACSVIEDHHKSLFNAQNSYILKYIDELSEFLTQRIGRLQVDIKRLQEKKEDTSPFLIVRKEKKSFEGRFERGKVKGTNGSSISGDSFNNENAQESSNVEEPLTSAKPWSFWDRSVFTMLLIVSVVAIAIGVNTIYTYLIGSGLIPAVNDNQWLGYLFATVPILAAIAIKSVISSFKLQNKQSFWGNVVGILGILFAAVWIAIFAYKFSSSLQTDDKIIGEIIRGTEINGNKFDIGKLIDKIFVGLQVLAEVFIASASWVRMGVMYEERYAERKIPNPHFKQLDDEIKKMDKELIVIKHKSANHSGMKHTLEAKRDALVTRAVAYYKSL